MKEKVILCIDDEKTILESLKSQLRRNLGDDYIYELAEDAEEGLEILEELMEDNLDIILIVSDWLMPGMKGDEFLIKVHKKYPNIPKILLTGQADEDAIEKAEEQAGLFQYMSKPWEEAELVGAIKEKLI